MLLILFTGNLTALYFAGGLEQRKLHYKIKVSNCGNIFIFINYLTMDTKLKIVLKSWSNVIKLRCESLKWVTTLITPGAHTSEEEYSRLRARVDDQASPPA